MTKFLDGPAADVVLLLGRAPHFLRAVQDAAGKWDALDQLTDEPRPDETVVVYELVRGPWRAHISRSVKGRRVCSWHEGGEYRVLAEQPPDSIVRDRAKWRQWAADEWATRAPAKAITA